MRVLQNIHLYRGHIAAIDDEVGPGAGFAARAAALVGQGLNGPHLLEPVVTGSPDAFLTSTADVAMQRAWAVENGLSPDLSPHHILLAQIEAFRPDILYTQVPGAFPDDVRRKIADLVKIRICWKAPPDFSGDTAGFQLALNNFPASFPLYEAAGIRAAWFSPSFDPQMEPWCDNRDRPIDVAFIGTYSRHHRKRAAALETIAGLSRRHKVEMALTFDRATRLANTPLGLIPPLTRYRASRHVRGAAIPPLYGRAMYRLFSQAKIVVNTAIDVAGEDRGNIRCFEALGCGALMISDSGRYPPGMVDGETLVTYDSIDQIPALVDALVADEERRRTIAAAGLALMRGRYSKAELWRQFRTLAESVA